MKKIFFYLARILSILIVAFFAMFILEGFSPEFSWADSLSHLILTLIVLVVAITSFKWPKIGGWIFIVLGLAFMVFFWSKDWNSIIIGGVPLITGILFLAE
jgi:hypothetical protein